MNNKQRQAHATLKRAKALIEKHGWIQHDYGDKQKGFCASGALRKASNDVWLPQYEAESIFNKCLKGHLNLIEYNDTTKRTKNQVLKVFDRAIKLATTFDVDSI
jgi:hypothetical protein